MAAEAILDQGKDLTIAASQMLVSLKSVREQVLMEEMPMMASDAIN